MSWVQRDYILRTGQAGKDSWDSGWAIPIVDALIFYQFGWNYIVRGVQIQYVDGAYRLMCMCDVTSLSPTQIADLDAFMNGPNNAVIGTYPPRLVSPPVTFQRIAYANQLLEIIRQDLVGRGLGRQMGMFVGDTLEYWTNVAYSAGNKNQLANMWKERFIDASTGRPL